MPSMILMKGERRSRLLGYSFGRATALQTMNDALEQLRNQLAVERKTRQREIVVELQETIVILTRELRQARIELALRDVLANAESPSAMVH